MACRVDLRDLELRAAHVDGKLLALEIGQRLDLVVLGEDDEIGEREAGADDAHRHAFLIELLQDCRPADQHIGLAGGEGRVEGGDRGIGFGVELEAVLGVEAACLHDVPDQRIEHRQRQAGDFDDRLLLRLRGADAVPTAQSRKQRKRGKAASRQVRTWTVPPRGHSAVILRVTWPEGERDFTPLSFACK